MSENYRDNQREFKEFEMWHDYFGLAELIERGKLRVKQQAEDNRHQSVSFPAEEPESNQPKKKEKRKHKLCFARLPYLRPRCAFCKSIHHLVRGLRGETTCPVLRTYICPICQATGDNAHTTKFCPKYY